MYNISQKNSNFTRYSSSYYLPNATSVLKTLWELDEKQKSSIEESETVISEQNNWLKNWEKWLRIHKTEARCLADTLNRPSECLLMNSECKRYVNEQKWLIEKCNEYVVSDYYRGHPDFWKVPGRRNFDRTKPEAPLPQQTYVGVPDKILQEQGITKRCLPTIKEKWDNSVYVKNKLHELKDKIKMIEPHRPDTNLIISGDEILPPSDTIRESKMFDSSSEQTYKRESIDYEESVTTLKSDSANEVPIALLLGNVILESKDSFLSKKPGEPMIWRVVFKDCKVNENYQQKLEINNLSNSTVQYDWKSILPPQHNHSFPFKLTRKFVPRFNFNKCSNILLPSEKQQFEFWFKSSESGVFKEQWELQTDPIFNEGRPLIITLEGFVTGVCDLSHIESINKYIKSQIISTKAKNIVEEIKIRMKYEPKCEEFSYDTKFSEEEIFLHNNPALYYDSNSVTVLKYLNKKISDVEMWDYSVKNLRDKLLNKKVNYADKQESLRIFYNALHKLQQPSFQTVLPNRRYMAVYKILGSFVQSIHDESVYLRKCFNVDETLCNPSISNSDGTNKLRKQIRKSEQVLTNKRTSRTHNFKTSTVSISTVSDSKCSEVFSVSETEFTGQKSQSSLETKKQFKKQKYYDIFYIRIYTLLSKTIDKIFVTLSSIDLQEDTTICPKECITK